MERRQVISKRYNLPPFYFFLKSLIKNITAKNGISIGNTNLTTPTKSVPIRNPKPKTIRISSNFFHHVSKPKICTLFCCSSYRFTLSSTVPSYVCSPLGDSIKVLAIIHGSPSSSITSFSVLPFFTSSSIYVL